MNLRPPREPMPGAIECVLDLLSRPLPIDAEAERQLQERVEDLKRRPRLPWRNDWEGK